MTLIRIPRHAAAIFIIFLFIRILFSTSHLREKAQQMKILKKNCKIFDFQSRESYMAHYLLDKLEGIEIGGSIHNPFCLNTINVDFTNETTIYKQHENKLSNGSFLKVDVIASGDNLPFKNETYDFVISSHAIEHFYDPIKTIKEWLRVIKIGGYVFMIIPHKELTFDKAKNRTTLNELLERHKNPDPNFVDNHVHHNIWITEDVIELCKNQNWKIVKASGRDDKVGNGFIIVIQKF